MLPHQHAIVSASVGLVGWWWTGNPVTGVAAMATGVLPDADHVVDYVYYRRHGTHRLILPFHGYEYALIGVGITLLTKNQILAIATLSYVIHLLADQMTNHTRLLGYSLLFRAWHRFRIEDISLVPEAAIRGRMDDMRAVKKLIRRSNENPC